MYSFSNIDYDLIKDVNSVVRKIKGNNDGDNDSKGSISDKRLKNISFVDDNDVVYSHLCNTSIMPFPSKEYQIDKSRELIDLIYSSENEMELPIGTFACWNCHRTFTDSTIWFLPKNIQKLSTNNQIDEYNFYGEGAMCSWYCSYMYGVFKYGQEGAEMASKFYHFLTKQYPIVSNKIMYVHLIKYGGSVSYEELDNEISKYLVDIKSKV